MLNMDISKADFAKAISEISQPWIDVGEKHRVVAVTYIEHLMKQGGILNGGALIFLPTLVSALHLSTPKIITALIGSSILFLFGIFSAWSAFALAAFSANCASKSAYLEASFSLDRFSVEARGETFNDPQNYKRSILRFQSRGSFMSTSAVLITFVSGFLFFCGCSWVGMTLINENTLIIN